MAENKDAIIVAIELGTSHISGIAGKRVNGNMQILAYAEEPSAGCVRRGKVFNIEKTTQNIKNVIDKLQTTLGKTIAQAYVGIEGQSVRSVHNKESRNMVTKSYITADHIEALREQSSSAPYPNCERLGTFEQGYIVDSTPVEDPIGVVGTNIEGEYLNIIANHQLRGNIEACFNNTEVHIAATKVSAYELSQNVLTDQEKRAGSVLVDLGAGTTTVVVYKNNIVRHLVTLPIGFASITQDLATLQIDEDEAEQVKKLYGNAYVEDTEEDAELLQQTYTTSFGTKIKVADIQHIVEARLTEIIVNVENQINLSGYEDQLLGGIVLTGGGSNIKNIEKAFHAHIKSIEKIRTARTLNQPIIKNSTVTNLSIDNGMGNSIISLLMSGEENCVGERYKGKDMFQGAESEEKIDATKRAAEEAAKKEADMAQRLEEYKDAIRKKITELNLMFEEVGESGSDKKVRRRATEKAESAQQIQDDGFKQAIMVLQTKDKYKQTISEAQALSTTLADTVDKLNDAVKQAQKENSFGTKFKNWLEDLAGED
ncbi:MAG: cell division protein FtsA [Bacteroidaceae bacterium]|nr:cell division protein FtsA [Bacteroidaceae bacterium]MDO4993764.1 cell division protein FtsA [Bacteroidales bacterium]